MKKQIAATVCAAALALALPMSAFAADGDSREQKTVTTSGNGTTAVIQGDDAAINGYDGCHLIIEQSDHTASNVPAGLTPVVTYRIYYSDLSHEEILSGTVMLTVGTQYANYNYTIYIEHEDFDGTYRAPETYSGVLDENGNAYMPVQYLSYYSIVIGDKVNTSTDSSSTSPKTGTDFAVAGGAACIAIAGAGVAFAARRKVNE